MRYIITFIPLQKILSLESVRTMIQKQVKCKWKFGSKVGVRNGMKIDRRAYFKIWVFNLAVLLLFNSCFNLNERVNSCYVENQCNIAVLNCMLNYQAVTVGKSD